VHDKTTWIMVFLAMLLLIPGGMAFTAYTTSIDPSIMNPGDPVNVSGTVYAASGTAFPVYDDLQFVTMLDDPVWSYTIIVNGIQNTRPPERGRILTISGYELAYRNQDEVTVEIALRGHVPATAATGANITLMKIQELDSGSKVIPATIYQAGHLVGQPTPTPTPASGSVSITSDPAGAEVYIDNTIRGISPVTLDAVPNGRHAVLLRLDGYDDYTGAVTVTGDAPRLTAVLIRTASTPVPAATGTETTAPATGSAAGQPTVSSGTGSLSVTTSPPGALVSIDGQIKGITPATIPGLTAGNHSVVLTLDGYQDFKTTTDIAAGTTSEFITGLSKVKQAPGYACPAALAAMGLVLAIRENRRRKN